jgi:hypothetical protein
VAADVDPAGDESGQRNGNKAERKRLHERELRSYESRNFQEMSPSHDAGRGIKTLFSLFFSTNFNKYDRRNIEAAVIISSIVLLFFFVF